MVDDDDAVVIDLSDSVAPTEPPPSPVTPRRWWLAGLIAVVLVGWLAHGQAPPGHAPDSPATQLPDLPRHIAAAGLTSLGEDLGTVLVPTRPPILVDTSAGTSVPILGLPAGAGDYRAADLGDRRFLVTAVDPTGTVQAYLVVGSQARWVAAGEHVVPGADGSSVLVTRTDGVRGVQRYGLDGSPLGDPVALGPDEELTFETIAGWVIASLDGAQLRDPTQPRRPGGFFTPYAATPTELAYTPLDGGLTVAGLASGGRYTYLKQAPLPSDRWVLAGAALQADGRRLAVHTVSPLNTAHAVQVFDLQAGTWTAMPGTPVRLVMSADAGENALTLAWSGDVLIVVTADGEAVLWRPGDPQVYAVPDPVTPRPQRPQHPQRP